MNLSEGSWLENRQCGGDWRRIERRRQSGSDDISSGRCQRQSFCVGEALGQCQKRGLCQKAGCGKALHLSKGGWLQQSGRDGVAIQSGGECRSHNVCSGRRD